MLNKQNRLKSKQAFSATYYNKKFISDNNIVLYLGKIKINENCPTRVGFVVSKKVSKRAVKRNRIKRLMRENVRLIFKNNNISVLNKFQSLIFMARNESLGKDFKEIEKSILTLLNKLAIKNI